MQVSKIKKKYYVNELLKNRIATSAKIKKNYSSELLKNGITKSANFNL